MNYHAKKTKLEEHKAWAKKKKHKEILCLEEILLQRYV